MAQAGVEPAARSTTPRRHSRRTWIVLLVVVVAVVVVLAGAAWYIINSGFGSVGPPVPGVSIWHEETQNGFRWFFGYWTPEGVDPVPWTDLTFEFTDGSHTAYWSNISSQDLDNGTLTTHGYGSQAFGDMTVRLNVTDIEGNGVAEWEDGFEITTAGGSFRWDDVYLLLLIWEPNGDHIGTDFIVWDY